jgi:hypothetical protein
MFSYLIGSMHILFLDMVVTKRERVWSTYDHPDNSIDPQSNHIFEVPPPIVTSNLFSLRSCTILCLNARTVPHIHIAHIIFTFTTLAIDSDLAFHSLKVYWACYFRPRTGLSSYRTVHKTPPFWPGTLSICTHLQWPWSASSILLDNCICTRLSSTQNSDVADLKLQGSNWSCGPTP